MGRRASSDGLAEKTASPSLFAVIGMPKCSILAGPNGGNRVGELGSGAAADPTSATRPGVPKSPDGSHVYSSAKMISSGPAALGLTRDESYMMFK